VAARFLNVFLKFALTYFIPASSYGEMGKTYVYTTFLAVLFTYGLETAYFRFVQQHKSKQQLFNTSFSSILGSTVLLSLSMIIWAQPLADLFKISAHPEWVRWFAFILGFDALAAIPFARLRQEQRPVKYAFIKFLNVFLQVVFILYFLVLCPSIQRHHPGSLLLRFYDPSIGVGYVFIANLIASALTLCFLYKELSGFRPHIDRRLWKKLILYSLPLVIVGFGGMINEVVDRILLDYLLPYPGDVRNTIIAIYQVGYQFAMLINIFIQIFRMGAEPFFFNEMDKSNAKETYARVMKFFVIGSCWMFLGIVLFRDVWQALNLVDIRSHPEYAESFKVIPQLALAYVCLGIYYNLSIWYKLTNRTVAGAVITLVGVVVTLVLNFWWIPRYSYVGCAWASFFCYFVMMILSFIWGQKKYPVPYEWKKLGGYFVGVIIICIFHQWIKAYFHHFLWSIVSGVVLLIAFMAFTLMKDREEFAKLPIVGKYLGTAR
jgi:O-antigen/teichoic acid export membrane protein